MSSLSTEGKPLTDEELIAAFQRGDSESYTLLVRRYKDPIINYLYRYLGSYDEADDVAQETFLRLYRKGHLYQPLARFSTWLYTIATNLARTHLLRRKRFLSLGWSDRRNEKDDPWEHVSGTTRLPDELADDSLRDEMIQNALNRISPKYRDMIILCDIQDLTYEEISAITGVNIGTVKSRLNRGRSQLQKLLKGLKDE